jgi:hypothetical protein
MKKTALRYLTAFALIGLAMAAAICLNHNLRAQAHRELQHCMADARTLAAAVRYLVQTDLPDSRPNPTDLEFVATNLAKIAVRPTVRVTPGVTNLPSVTVSNGVATTQAEMTVPG